MTELGDLLRPIDCYIARVESNGKWTEIVRRCGSSSCPTNKGS